MHERGAPPLNLRSLNMTAVLPFPTRREARTLSDGDVAKLIRAELRAAFPATKFRVFQSRGVSSINVKWTDGPSAKAVGAIVGKFNGRGFDGMTDSTFYYPAFELAGEMVRTYCSVNTSRSMSPRFVERVIAAAAKYWGLESIPAVRTSDYDGTGSVAASTEQDREAFARTGMWWSDLVYRGAADRRRVEFGNV